MLVLIYLGLVDSFAAFRIRGGVGGFGIPDKPEETLGGSVLLSLELVAAEVLDVLGLEGGGKLAVAEFLKGRVVSLCSLQCDNSLVR